MASETDSSPFFAGDRNDGWLVVNVWSYESESRKQRRQTEEEMGRQHQGMDRPGVRKVPEGCGEQRTLGGGEEKMVVKSSMVPQ